jgi:hypothetical protein
MTITTIGLGLAKSVFQAHGVDERGASGGPSDASNSNYVNRSGFRLVETAAALRIRRTPPAPIGH